MTLFRLSLSLSANRPRFAGHSEDANMPKLKLGPITDDKPVKVTLDLPAALHRDLVAYAAALAREQGQPIPDPTKLIAPMLARFMARVADLQRRGALNDDPLLSPC
jgi:hypothetical protein